jgi:RNA polymerase sigma-70 factor, ECF subfamily
VRYDVGRHGGVVEWSEIYDRLVVDPNDAGGWSALLRRVHGWARTRLASADGWVLDEVSADTCSAVALKMSLARGRDTFATFVYGYFLNACRRYIRYRDAGMKNVALDEIDVPAPPAYDPEQARIAAITTCLESLPPRDRQAVTMRYLQEASPAAIAEALGVNDGYARRIVFNGLQRIRDCVGVGGRSRRRATTG